MPVRPARKPGWLQFQRLCRWWAHILLKTLLICKIEFQRWFVFFNFFIWAHLHFENRTFSFVSVLKEKWEKNNPKWAKFQNWLKTHPKVINSQNKWLFHNFGHPKSHFWALENGHFCQKWPISGTKNGTLVARNWKRSAFVHCAFMMGGFCHYLNQTSQELRMLSNVTLDCQVTKIVMNSGSQL